LEFSKDLFLKISESVNDLICVLNFDLEVEYINEPVFLKTLGYSNDDLLGKKIKNFIYNWKFFVPGSQADPYYL